MKNPAVRGGCSWSFWTSTDFNRVLWHGFVTRGFCKHFSLGLAWTCHPLSPLQSVCLKFPSSSPYLCALTLTLCFFNLFLLYLCVVCAFALQLEPVCGCEVMTSSICPTTFSGLLIWVMHSWTCGKNLGEMRQFHASTTENILGYSMSYKCYQYLHLYICLRLVIHCFDHSGNSDSIRTFK